MLVAEVERARDRRDWSEDQWAKAFDWLEKQGFDLNSVDIDQGTLEAVLPRLRAESEAGREPPDGEIRVPPAPDLSINGRKRTAVDNAIQTLGVDALLKKPQKVREPEIKKLAESELGGSTVTERYVRNRLAEAKRGTFLGSGPIKFLAMGWIDWFMGEARRLRHGW
jgi:hypothetical protein